MSLKSKFKFKCHKGVKCFTDCCRGIDIMLTPYDMAQLVAGYFKLNNNFIQRANSSTFSQPAKRPAKTGFIIDKAVKELGYRPHSFKEGIKIIADQLG